MEEVNTFLAAAKSILADRDWLDAIGSFLAGLGTIALTVVAYKQLPKAALIQRETQKEEHKFQLAKDAIDAFRASIDAIQLARRPVLAGEQEPKGQQIIRLINEADPIFTKLRQLEPHYEVVFKTKIPFQEVYRVRSELLDAAILILNGDPQTNHTRVIFNFGENNQITDDLEKVMLDVIAHCQPVLRGEK
jgi:hypothetical protein